MYGGIIELEGGYRCVSEWVSYVKRRIESFR